jgi:acetyl esterase/lipase
MPTEPRQEEVLTLTSPLTFALSLSPPRSPPFESAQRALLMGYDPSNFPLTKINRSLLQPNSWNDKDPTNDASNPYWTEHWIRSILQKSYQQQKKSNTIIRHPHLSNNRDNFTLWLDRNLSVSTWNQIRDEGWFRSICDTLVLLGIPFLAMSSPRSTLAFVKLSRQVQFIPYGTHRMQIIELLPSQSNSQNVLVFVHGGAWGSGSPWMYRLVARGFPDYIIAIVGYRTYPDADIPGQVSDLTDALKVLTSHIPQASSFTLIGHSSGAQIAQMHILMMAHTWIQSAKFPTTYHCPYTAFVGLSGPYDIASHYHFEAARGVEEVSPLKAAGGFTEINLIQNSPGFLLEQILLSSNQTHYLTQYFPTRILLLHGMDDATVPFTATVDWTRRLQSVGIPAQSCYLPRTGHQDTVLQLMLGTDGSQKTLEYIQFWLNSEKDKVPGFFGIQSKL